MEVKEVWKSYDNNYLVSSLGNVWSIRREILLKQSLDGYGYKTVTINSITTKVHRMVAIVFLGKPENNLTVNHKNGIKADNRLENLEWMTSAENNKHASETGLVAYGSNVHTALLDNSKVEAIKLLFVEYSLGDTEIGKIFGVNNSTISNIRRKIAWKHVRPDLIFETKSPFGRGSNKKLCGEDIPKIRILHKEGHSRDALAKLFKVNSGTIGSILSGKNWKNY